MVDLSAFADAEFCYLTTTGRRTGRAHEIEIWFVLLEGVVYLMAGGGDRSDWVRNLRADPAVRLRMGSFEGPATATVVDDDGEHAVRRRMAARYQGWDGDEAHLSDWARQALLVAVVPD